MDIHEAALMVRDRGHDHCDPGDWLAPSEGSAGMHTNTVAATAWVKSREVAQVVCSYSRKLTLVLMPL